MKKNDINSKKQFSLTFWFDMLLKDYAKLRPYQRAKISLECWKILVGKAKTLPSDPSDSAFNGLEAMEQLKALESSLSPASLPTVGQPTVGPTDKLV